MEVIALYLQSHFDPLQDPSLLDVVSVQVTFQKDLHRYQLLCVHHLAGVRQSF